MRPRTPKPQAIRNHPDYKSTPISAETYAKLLGLLDVVYPGKWRRSVDVCPVAVNKTIDNEADALETIRRIEARLAKESSIAPPGLRGKGAA